MNEIEKLIQELCPDGVEYRRLGDVCYISDYVSNGSFASIRESVAYKKEPDYAVLIRFADYSNNFDASKFVYIDKHAYDFLSKSRLEGGEIIMSNVGSCGSFFRCPDLKMPMSLAPNSIVIKSEYNDFLFHWFGTYEAQEEIRRITSKSAMPKFNKTEFRKIEIPFPPITTQEKIVEILDKFTSLEAELQAELEARRKQYEYYREKLLTFSPEEVEYRQLGEVCKSICSGGTPKTTKPEYYNGTIPWLRTQEVDWNDIIDTSLKISYEGLRNSSAKMIPVNCVIVAMYGATAAKVAINKIPLCTNQACCNLEIDDKIALFRYVYHWLCKEFENLKALGEGSQPNLNAQKIKNYPIPLPPITVQEKIVEILDKFTSLETELETELEARRQQYEYYREKLLTFKRKTVEI